MPARHLQSLSLLDALRPPPGWRTDRALLASYSAEPGVLAATLLALSGVDRDDAGGSAVALARALDSLRGRAHFAIQRGRLAAPRRYSRALALLDRFVRQVPLDEGAQACWHPKVALVRHVPDTGTGEAGHRWSLWIGSRNLTRDVSWDLGMSLAAEPQCAAAATTLEGVAELAEALAAAAAESSAWRNLLPELSSARWEAPPGLHLRRVRLMGQGGVPHAFPDPPAGLRRVVAVAPFLSASLVARVGRWGGKGTERTLISTREAIHDLARRRLTAMAGYRKVLALPDFPDDGITGGEGEDDAADRELDVKALGLHAKFIWAEHRDGATLWFGSPNLTERAWSANAEAFAEVAVNSRSKSAHAASLRDGMVAFEEMGEPIDLAGVPEESPGDVRGILERARAQVAAKLDGRQTAAGEGKVRVELKEPPHPEDLRVELSAARLGGSTETWPRGERVLLMQSSLAEPLSEFLCLRVSLGGESLDWMQTLPFDPPLPLSRDIDGLRSFLGAEGLLAWIQQTLSGEALGDDGSDWDGQPDAASVAGRQGRRASQQSLPTVEQVVRAWARDPTRLQAVSRLLQGGARGGIDLRGDGAAERHLRQFQKSWRVLHASLTGTRQ